MLEYPTVEWPVIDGGVPTQAEELGVERGPWDDKHEFVTMIGHSSAGIHTGE